MPVRPAITHTQQAIQELTAVAQAHCQKANTKPPSPSPSSPRPHRAGDACLGRALIGIVAVHFPARPPTVLLYDIHHRRGRGGFFLQARRRRKPRQQQRHACGTETAYVLTPDLAAPDTWRLRDGRLDPSEAISDQQIPDRIEVFLSSGIVVPLCSQRNRFLVVLGMQMIDTGRTWNANDRHKLRLSRCFPFPLPPKCQP